MSHPDDGPLDPSLLTRFFRTEPDGRPPGRSAMQSEAGSTLANIAKGGSHESPGSVLPPADPALASVRGIADLMSAVAQGVHLPVIDHKISKVPQLRHATSQVGMGGRSGPIKHLPRIPLAEEEPG